MNKSDRLRNIAARMKSRLADLSIDTLSFDSYYRLVSEMIIHPGDLSFKILELCGEVGELANEHKKALREGESWESRRDEILSELGDVFWSVCATMHYLGVDPRELMHMNLTKIRERFRRVHEQESDRF